MVYPTTYSKTVQIFKLLVHFYCLLTVGILVAVKTNDKIEVATVYNTSGTEDSQTANT